MNQVMRHLIRRMPTFVVVRHRHPMAPHWSTRLPLAYEFSLLRDSDNRSL
jgi:hypothetical protein